MVAWAFYFVLYSDLDGLPRVGSPEHLAPSTATPAKDAVNNVWHSPTHPPSGILGRPENLTPYRPLSENGTLTPQRVGGQPAERPRTSPWSVEEKRATSTQGARRENVGMASDPAALQPSPFDISGEVVNEAGHPVVGIEVAALGHRLFAEPPGSTPARGDLPEQKVVTDSTGRFVFRGLANGEYEIRTLESHFYPASSSVRVRAGTDSVRLVAVEQRDILVDGYVTDVEGNPLEGVHVFLFGPSEPAAVSDSLGAFSFLFQVRSDRTYQIALRAEGYREHKLSLSKDDWLDDYLVELDVPLQRELTLTTVSGLVRSTEGKPITGEQIYLQRSQKKYKTVTNESGRFLFTEVESGVGYALWLVPNGPFRQFRQEGIKIPAKGLDNLEVVLDPVGFGRITGRVLDASGNPVPGFPLLVRSESARSTDLQVSSGPDGYFAVDNVADGYVRLETGSFPKFITSGIQLPPGGDIEVNTVLDIGNREIAGVVTDTRGKPVPGADLILSWLSRQTPFLHESLRMTVSAADGGFVFSGLGPEPHTVIARAPGFESVKMEGVSGQHNEIRLEPIAQ